MRFGAWRSLNRSPSSGARRISCSDGQKHIRVLSSTAVFGSSAWAAEPSTAPTGNYGAEGPSPLLVDGSVSRQVRGEGPRHGHRGGLRRVSRRRAGGRALARIIHDGWLPDADLPTDCLQRRKGGGLVIVDGTLGRVSMPSRRGPRRAKPGGSARVRLARGAVGSGAAHELCTGRPGWPGRSRAQLRSERAICGRLPWGQGL